MKLPFCWPKLGWCLLLGLLMSGYAQAQPANYKAQSLFIYKFIKHVHWPREGNGPFVVGVLGDSPLKAELKRMARIKETPEGQPIVILELDHNQLKEAQDCHLVFVTDRQTRNIDELVPHIEGKPILLVAERDHQIRKGAAINFTTVESNLLRFSISLEELREHNLEIDRRFLKLGFVVDD